MPKNLYKILIVLSIFFIFIVSLLFLFYSNEDENLKVSFLDVGQGDASLIQSPYGQNILIDGGPDSSVLEGLGNNLSFWDRQIDLMILTHPHDDHVTGLIDVLERYQVKKILYTGVLHTSPNYIGWLDLVKNKKIPMTIIDRPQKVILGEDCFLDIIYPREDFLQKSVDNLNNTSIVAKLVYRNDSFLFTGDIETEVEDELVDANVDLKADILKISHHGSDTSSTQDFLDKVSPKRVVIQVGENNFGHPTRRTMLRLEKMGLEIFRNDRDGEVDFISNGDKY